jgi:hypothetical protein
MDDEVKGEGNSVNYKYRMHDPRVGRFFAVDPLTAKYPHNSPYAFSENRVINAVELEGLESYTVIGDLGLTAGPQNLNFNAVAGGQKRSKPGLGIYITNAKGIIIKSINRPMTPMEMGNTGNRMQLDGRRIVPAGGLREGSFRDQSGNSINYENSMNCGLTAESYFITTTLRSSGPTLFGSAGAQGTVPFFMDFPNTIVTNASGTIGNTGSESINIPIAGGADAIVLSVNTSGTNVYTLTNQNGIIIPMTPTPGTAGRSIGVPPVGTTEVNLTVTGIPSNTPWLADVETTGPNLSAKTVPGRSYRQGNASSITKGMDVLDTHDGGSNDKPKNSTNRQY